MVFKRDLAMADTNASGPKKGGLFGKIFCEHDWIKRENWHQLDRSSGKIAWKCSRCGKAIKRPKSFTGSP